MNKVYDELDNVTPLNITFLFELKNELK